jgi:hypothetical protein
MMYREESALPGDTRKDIAFQRLLRQIELTEDHEIDCTTCLERVPMYVDREIAAGNMAMEMPEMHVHLALCGDCFEEYEALRDLVVLDLSGNLPDMATLLSQLDRG